MSSGIDVTDILCSMKVAASPYIPEDTIMVNTAVIERMKKRKVPKVGSVVAWRPATGWWKVDTITCEEYADYIATHTVASWKYVEGAYE